MVIFEKSKAFVKKHKNGILFIGGTVLGVIVTVAVCKSKKVEPKIELRFPEWASKWMDKCNSENLLYENGLPIFANEEQTVVYRDACDPEAIPELIECGYEIVERA